MRPATIVRTCRRRSTNTRGGRWSRRPPSNCPARRSGSGTKGAKAGNDEDGAGAGRPAPSPNQRGTVRMLQVNNIEVIYSDVILVLKGLSLVVPQGQIVALLGANGAGKSTTLKAISGLLKSEEGEVTDGEILFEGVKINGRDAEEIVRRGIFQVMEGRRVFEDLTVEENLRCGAHTRKDTKNVKGDYDRVYGYFPRLKERRKQLAGYLSGGEQQMLAIGRALMARPKLMLLA